MSARSLGKGRCSIFQALRAQLLRIARHGDGGRRSGGRDDLVDLREIRRLVLASGKRSISSITAGANAGSAATMASRRSRGMPLVAANAAYATKVCGRTAAPRAHAACDRASTLAAIATTCSQIRATRPANQRPPQRRTRAARLRCLRCNDRPSPRSGTPAGRLPRPRRRTTARPRARRPRCALPRLSRARPTVTFAPRVSSA